ncbi:MAG: hypothetical protein WCE52_12995 [Candidatus Acidiferrum sp.]
MSNKFDKPEVTKRYECGGNDCLYPSDSQFLPAIAGATTKFPGCSANDLKRAIREESTEARGRVKGLLVIAEFLQDRRAWKRFCDTDPILWLRDS